MAWIEHIALDNDRLSDKENWDSHLQFTRISPDTLGFEAAKCHKARFIFSENDLHSWQFLAIV